MSVSCTSSLLEQTCDFPNTHNVPSEVDFESSRSPAVSKFWNCHNPNCWTVFPIWQYCLYLLVKWLQEIKRARRLSQALAHFVIARVSLFTIHRISGLPIRSKYRHFRTIWEHSFDNFSYGFQFFFFELMIIKTWSWYLIKLMSSLVCQFTKTFHTFFGMTFHIVRPRRHTQFFRAMKLWHSRGTTSTWCLMRRLTKAADNADIDPSIWIRTWFCNCQPYLYLFHIVFECIPSKHDRGMMQNLPSEYVC